VFVNKGLSLLGYIGKTDVLILLALLQVVLLESVKQLLCMLDHLGRDLVINQHIFLQTHCYFAHVKTTVAGLVDSDKCKVTSIDTLND
jgi:hypothetical protein